MTVIAYSNGYIAADMQQVVGPVIGPPCQKLVLGSFKKATKNIWFVVANYGTAIDNSLAVETAKAFLRDPIKYVKANTLLPEEAFVCGVSYTQGDENYRIFNVHDKGAYFYDPTPESIAWGAGEEAAIAAMHMGASASKAAQIACLTTIECGGPISWIDLTKDADGWRIEGGDEASFNRIKRRAK